MEDSFAWKGESIRINILSSSRCFWIIGCSLIDSFDVHDLIIFVILLSQLLSHRYIHKWSKLTVWFLTIFSQYIHRNSFSLTFVVYVVVFGTFLQHMWVQGDLLRSVKWHAQNFKENFSCFHASLFRFCIQITIYELLSK